MPKVVPLRPQHLGAQETASSSTMPRYGATSEPIAQTQPALSRGPRHPVITREGDDPLIQPLLDKMRENVNSRDATSHERI